MAKPMFLDVLLCVAFGVVSSGATLCDRAKVIQHRQFGDALGEWRVVSAGDFGETNAKACARSVVADHPRSLLNVQYFSDAALAAFLTQPTSGGVPLWQVHRGLALRKRWDIAGVTATPRGAVIRFRFGRRVGREVLSGEDPTVAIIDDVHYDIAWIAISHSGVHVFATADRPVSVQSGRKLLQHLLLTIPEKPLRVVLRNDYWFPEEPDFPAFYPFAPDSFDPPADSVAKGREIECTARRSEQDCWLVPSRR